MLLNVIINQLKYSLTFSDTYKLHANCSRACQLPFPSDKSGSHIHAFLFDPPSLTKAIV